MRPLIAVSPLMNEKRGLQLMQPGYLRGIELAGGAPVVLPMTEDLWVLEDILRGCSGLLLPGGHDVEPALYGQALLPECGELCRSRDKLEGRLLTWALERDIPILGICRGAQMLNVHLGGTLYQDLPTQRPASLEHSQQPPYEQTTHRVTVLEGGLLAGLIGAGELAVNSLHHQAIDRVASGLVVDALSEDGLVEGVHLPGKRFVLGVQWHPEYCCEQQTEALGIFRGFLKACQDR